MVLKFLHLKRSMTNFTLDGPGSTYFLMFFKHNLWHFLITRSTNNILRPTLLIMSLILILLKDEIAMLTLNLRMHLIDMLIFIIFIIKEQAFTTSLEITDAVSEVHVYFVALYLFLAVFAFGQFWLLFLLHF